MDYLLLVWIDGSVTLSPEDTANLGPDVEAWLQEMDGRGVRVHGSALAPVRDATTIRARQRNVTVADGPVAESKDYVAGFDVLKCADRDEAIEVASKHPVARFGRIELRPLL